LILPNFLLKAWCFLSFNPILKLFYLFTAVLPRNNFATNFLFLFILLVFKFVLTFHLHVYTFIMWVIAIFNIILLLFYIHCIYFLLFQYIFLISICHYFIYYFYIYLNWIFHNYFGNYLYLNYSQYLLQVSLASYCNFFKIFILDTIIEFMLYLMCCFMKR
jgi:hypothetical protein